MFGHPLKFSDFFNQDVPNNPLHLIRTLPKDELIATITAVNTRLKNVYSSGYDISRQTQIECLRAVLDDFKNPINRSFAKPFVEKFLLLPDNFQFFTRVTCLYAMQWILSSNEFPKERPVNYTLEQRIGIFKFLLICNEKILFFNQQFNDTHTDALGERFFEYYMFKEIPHNQYFYHTNPLNKFYKGWYLMDVLSKDLFYGKHFKSYLKEIFDIDSLTEFFKFIIAQFFQSNDDNLKVNYLKIRTDLHPKSIEILKVFSERLNLPLPDEASLEILDFLELKKNPVYDGGESDKIHFF